MNIATQLSEARTREKDLIAQIETKQKQLANTREFIAALAPHEPKPEVPEAPKKEGK